MLANTNLRGVRRTATAMLMALAVLALPHKLPARAAAGPPPSADALVAAGLKTAQAGGKVLLIEFGASWCTWCRSFDAFVHAPDVRQIIANNYVIVNLTVQERDDKKALENPGGQEKMTGWGGAKSGLPFYVFLDAAGRKIADSNAMPDGSNIGFPGTPQELQVFVGVLDRTAPRMSKVDRAAIVGYLDKVVQK